MNRYCRQIQFEAFGESGQRALQQATVAIIGCGGLGTQQAEALVRMGVGGLKLADFDLITQHNLHRQHLFTEADIGLPKVEVLARRLQEINSTCHIETYSARVEEIGTFVGQSTAVLDATDSIPTRFALNDWCVKHHVPFVYGGVAGSEGMVLPVHSKLGSPCLRCLYPELPKERVNIATSGIWPPLVTQVASVQVTLLIQLLMGNYTSLGKLFLFDSWKMTMRSVNLSPRQGCICHA